MGESESHGRLINPCFFHLQKLELELKCPACSCITASTGCGLACPICKLSLLAQETNKSDVKHQDLCNRDIAGKSQKSNAKNIFRQKTIRTTVEAFAEQGGPCSPPSSGGLKYSDDDSNDRGSVLSGKSLLASGSHKTNLPVNKSNLFEEIAEDKTRTAFQVEEDHGRDIKRQKLNTDSRNGATKSDMDDKLNDVDCQYASKNTSFCSQSGYEGATKFTPSSIANEGTSDIGFPCEFCHSTKESKASGPLGHYADGEPVDGEAARRPNVLHVHQKCIEWAPQVFFVGDTVKNLEAEISRASKIKCSHCGTKGAALGCYAKSCRKSFHVPCAVEIKDCRWDCDNFLILCPAHSSRKLPSDRSNMGKNVRNLSPADSNLGSTKSSGNHTSGKQHAYELWLAPPDATKGWVLCGSALSLAEKDMVAKLARLTGAVVTKDWRPDVTHVIASTDPYGACSRTLKFLMAILSGKWILKIDWIRACLEAKHPVSEDNYEISHDIHGCFDGPMNGRIRLMEQAPKLFSGLSFYFSGDFVPTYKGYLEDLISAAGGNILQENTDGSPSTTGLIVYNLDPPSEGDSQGAVDKRLHEANAVATRIGAQVIGHTWVLDSVAGCKLLPVFS
ncbi:hypothetical protein Taro_003984 [Colocasia esculenta]|uniref:Uncharacterized protein n=1 Tax=Colocasia esculenta TaxID=4460 RepID=A0A843TNB4_COLES|nr:hypothetical protein [Colocasia esculenta]